MHKKDVNKILEIYNKKDYSKNFIDYNLKWKKCKTLSLSSFSEFDFIETLLNEELKSIDENYEVSEFITLLKYQKGDFFDEHIDASSYSSGKSNTILSGGILLNNEYSGGNFIINSKTLNVDIGELFTFGRNEKHQVTKVTDGIRLSLHFAVNSTKINLI
tara:strand:+ start:14864 stop:15343 length:480 start_codon:yes stop_codon:yes gene_type:complete